MMKQAEKDALVMQKLLPQSSSVLSIVGDDSEPGAPSMQLPMPVLQQRRRNYNQVRASIPLCMLQHACKSMQIH